MRKFYLIFFLINIFLASFFLDSWENANTVSHILPVITVVESGTLQIDKYKDKTIDHSYVNGHYYTDKAPLPSFFVVPFLYLFHKIGIVKEDSGSLYGKSSRLTGSFFAGSLPFALIVLLIFHSIHKNAFASSPVLLSMLPLFGSFLFVFAGTFFGHLFAGALLLLAYIALQNKSFFFAGLFAGLGFMSDYPIALALAMWPLQIALREKSFKSMLEFVAGLVPPVLVMMSYNYYFTGSPFHLVSRYLADFWEDAAWREHYGFSVPSAKNLISILFTQYRGLFFFMPVLAMFVYAGLNKAASKPLGEIVSNYLFFFSIFYVLIISGRGASSGGWTFGPRYLIPLAVLLTYQGLHWIDWNKRNRNIFIFLCSLGILLAFMGKVTVMYGLPSAELRPLLNIIVPDFIQGKFHPNNVLTMLFGLDPIAAGLVFFVFFISSIFFLNSWYNKMKRENAF